ncbi:MAG: MGMT family protein [Trueperaceae bacterium]
MEDFRTRVLRVVRAVPPGRVTTYGSVAALAGSPGAARQVGTVLRGLTDADDDVPWQRVINAAGGISTYKVGSGELQVALLRSEGVEVEDDRVNLRRFGWTPDDDLIGLGVDAAADAARKAG